MSVCDACAIVHVTDEVPSSRSHSSSCYDTSYMTAPVTHGSWVTWSLVKSSVGHLGHGSLWVTHSLLCRNRLRLLTNHTRHYDHLRHPSRAMVLNIWTQGTIAWYVTSAHLLCIWWLWTLTYDLNLWTWRRYLGQRLFHASCSTFTHEITFHLDICHAGSPWPSLG